MAEETPKKKTNWLLGCGIGCGVLIVLAVVVGVAIVLLARKGMETASREMAENLASEYAQLKNTGKVPEQHAALFDEIVQIAQSSGASLYARTLCLAVVLGALDDGAVNESELKVAQDLLALLRGNPDLGMFQMSTFMQNHPQFQQTFGQYQGRYQTQDGNKPTVSEGTNSDVKPSAPPPGESVKTGEPVPEPAPAS